MYMYMQFKYNNNNIMIANTSTVVGLANEYKMLSFFLMEIL